MTIFKIATTDDWATAEKAGAFAGSAHDRSDGFIHFSTAAQLAETLKRYYAGQDGLLLIAVDDTALGAALKWELAPSRGEAFPHLYAPLPLTTVRWAKALTRDASGVHIQPALD